MTTIVMEGGNAMNWYVVDNFGNVIFGPMDKMSAKMHAQSNPNWSVVYKG